MTNAQILFDGLLEEKALELAMDVDVGGGGKGETLVFSRRVLLFGRAGMDQISKVRLC